MIAAVGDFVTDHGVWGKADRATGEFHHLAHHSADVAAVFQVLLEHPMFRARAEAALGQALTPQQVICLAALAFLHDLGKLAPAFQAKAWPDGHGLRTRGHLECGWLWLAMPRPDALAGAVAHLGRWPGIDDWFGAIFSHHGRPTAPAGEGLAQNAFPVLAQYDWRAEKTVLGQALLAWFAGDEGLAQTEARVVQKTAV